jgi:hypothetical protein
MNRKCFSIISIALLFSFAPLFSQDDAPPTYFGLHFKPLFPTNAVSPKTVSENFGNYSASITQGMGYSFGATVRAGITKLISFETGINHAQRNFKLAMSITDTAVFAQDQVGFVSYDIPLNILIYIQLDKDTYMNASLGFDAFYNPTNVVKLTQTGGDYSFENFGSATKVGLNINANVGFEYRTREKGFFYFGGSVLVPTRPLFHWVSAAMLQSHTDKTILAGYVNGSYLSLDLKYFFPIIKQKGVQPKKGPIE